VFIVYAYLSFRVKINGQCVRWIAPSPGISSNYVITVLSSNTWCFTTWTACFAGSDTGRIKIQFLSIVPWCLLQLSNCIHVVHSSTIRYTLLLYITPCLSSGRAAEHSPLSVTCYHLNSQNCLVYEHMSPFCIVVTVDIIMNVYLLLPLEGP
jgi:hypothetical protein